ncbi:MAG: T9SS type A sorting domain-containing protein [Ignavibacteriaceae bacterium]
MGSEFWKAIETVLSFEAFNPISLSDELLPQVSGMKYKYNPNNPPGTRLIEMSVGGEPIDSSVKYSVTGNEFAIVFFSNFLGFNVENIYYYEDSTEFQVLAEYISSLQIITPKVEGRIQAVETSAADEADYNPHTYKLNQNYPNPFNPVTKINYSIPQTNFVTIKVYDILGKEVAILVSEEKPAGIYLINFNAENLSSGVYFYRMTAGSFTSTKKFILIK